MSQNKKFSLALEAFDQAASDKKTAMTEFRRAYDSFRTTCDQKQYQALRKMNAAYGETQKTLSASENFLREVASATFEENSKS